ncbi:MAG: hypothetical protein QHJ81_14290 [Anaerolineae bacterium]|nr:hypothetical protein [Anaerolineae bacterium]
MTLSDIIEDLHAVELRLLDYEKRYGLHSEDFYALYSQGLLDDGELEETIDFTRWAGLYEIKQEREEMFRELSRAFVRDLRAKYPENRIRLTPNPDLVTV